jgi:glc operon protein GlcG
MDHAAMTASVELAMGKARSAAPFKKPTQNLEDAINHGRYDAITARGFIEMQGWNPSGSGWRGCRSHRRELRYT